MVSGAVTRLGVPVERVILWGFMASGKSAVGAELARRLGWEHVDLDREIERREGRSIAEIFRAEGEAYFRRLEVETTSGLIDRKDVVFACGGGWVTNPASARLMPPGSLTVWLQASPEAVLARVQAAGETEIRPLLAGPDPEATMRRLLAEREPLYRRADLVIRTDDRDVGSIAQELEARARGAASAPQDSSSAKHNADQG